MKNVQRSQAFLRKRKMMLVLPLLIIPFLTMAFWALGGGQGKQITIVAKQQGLNLNLPDSKLKDENLTDKLSFYDKADKDSLKMEEWMRSDPYYKPKQDTSIFPVNEIEQITQTTATKYNQRLNPSPYESSENNPEQKLLQKLSLLQREINNHSDTDINKHEHIYPANHDDEFSNEVDRLENMLQVMNKPNIEDPEMKQLNNTLEKIMDIQHPQRIKDKLKEKSLQQKEVVFAVNTQPAFTNISLLDTVKRKMSSEVSFYGIKNNQQNDEGNNAIEAVVHSNQVLVNGAVIKLRLITDIYINGVLIPKGNYANGIASLNNERLEIEINSIRYGNNLFPVKLEVYDLDGLPGIYIPGAITRDVAKQSADNSLQMMELTTLDPSLKAQAAAAGVNTVKSLLSRKAKQVKVTVKAGYKVLLRDKNTEQSF